VLWRDNRSANPRRYFIRKHKRKADFNFFDCPGPPGRVSGLSVLHSKSSFYGAFGWMRRVLNDNFRRFSALADIVHCMEDEFAKVTHWIAIGYRSLPHCALGFIPL
jgi:hypothetical protein